MNTTIRRPRLLSAAAVALASALLLTGCLEDVTGGGTSGPGSGDGSSTDGSTDKGSKDGADGEASDADKSSSKSCLVGSWKLNNKTFEEAMLKMIKDAPDMPADMKSDMSITISGDSFIRFGDGDDYGGWQDELTMTMKTRGSTISHVQDSSTSGNYGASDDFVWVSDVQILDVQATMSIDGLATVTLDSSSPGMASVDIFGWSGDVPGYDSDLSDGVAGYECSGDTLTMIADGNLRTKLTRHKG